MRRVVAVIGAAAWVAGCGGGSGTVANPPPSPPPASVDFTAFTKDLLKTQPDTTQPVAVSTVNFVFHDDDNPAAFASVLPGP